MSLPFHCTLQFLSWKAQTSNPACTNVERNMLIISYEIALLRPSWKRSVLPLQAKMRLLNLRLKNLRAGMASMINCRVCMKVRICKIVRFKSRDSSEVAKAEQFYKDIFGWANRSNLRADKLKEILIPRSYGSLRKAIKSIAFCEPHMDELETKDRPDLKCEHVLFFKRSTDKQNLLYEGRSPRPHKDHETSCCKNLCFSLGSSSTGGKQIWILSDFDQEREGQVSVQGDERPAWRCS